MPLTKVASSMLASGASGSGGSAGKNYISSYNGNPCNGDFESGSISGWSVFSVSSITNGLPSGAPTTIAAGGSNPDITLLSPGSQLAGQYSLQASFPTTSQYKGFITEVFTIDAQDRAQVLTFGFHYQLTSSASNVNFSGTSSNTFIVSIYAVDGSNAGWIQPAGVYSMTQSSGAGFATGTFQTYSDTTQYRFAILCFNNPTTTSATIKFDDFSVGPTVVVNGTPVTDWVDRGTMTIGAVSAPPSKGTTSIDKVLMRRVGDSAQFLYNYAQTGAGASAGTGDYLFSLPAGMSIDTSKIQLVSGGFARSGNTRIGSGTVSVTTSGTVGNVDVYPYSSTQVILYVSGAQDTAGTVSSAVDEPVGSGVFPTTTTASSYKFTFTVPIAGWSSNVQISSDTDTRVISFSGSQSSQAVTAIVTDIAFTTSIDKTGSWNGTQFVVPVAGDYLVSAAAVTSVSATLRVFVDGSSYLNGYIGASSSAGGNAAGGSTLVTGLRAGQLISVRSSATCTITVGNLGIFRLSGPSVVAASETVAMTYTGTATGTLTTGGTNFLATVPTKVFDTHNAYASGLYTVPVSGKYQVYAQLHIIATYVGGITTTRCEIRQAGSASTSISGQIGWPSGASANPTRPNTSIILNCIAGDTIAVYGGSDGSSLSYGAQCSVSIVRVGN